MMHILWEGRTLDYDIAKVDVKTAVVIRQHTGMGLTSWSKAVDDMDPIAVQALYWVVLLQNGEQRDITSLNFSVIEFMLAFNEAAVAEMVALAEADMRARGLDPQTLAEDEDEDEGATILAPTLTSAS